jgi:hypothetical protein
MSSLMVNGIVAVRDKKPYIQLSTEKGMVCQLSMTEARQVANDILTMASRTEADAMIVKFFAKQEYPEGAANALLVEFRDFRHELDMQTPKRTETDEAPPEKWEGELRYYYICEDHGLHQCVEMAQGWTVPELRLCEKCKKPCVCHPGEPNA